MGQKLGLVIGNSAYRDSTLASLATPDVDVGDLADVLLEPEVGDFNDVQVFVNASSATLRRAVSKFFSLKHRDDLLVLYFSGHGVLDENGRLYLAVKDTERQLLRGTAIPASFISDEMNNSRSKRQVLILDCCHSGAFGRGAKGVPGASVGTATAFEGTGYGRVVLTATDETQFAWEGDRAIGEPVNSVFTHYLIQGLKTGQADANGDGLITIDELYDYAYERVLKETRKQTPGKWSYREQGEIVIARSSGWKPKPEASDPFKESDEEVLQRLNALYTRGLSAYWLEEWDKAQYAFSSIVELQPDYKDAAAKLDEVSKKEKLQALYRQAKQGIDKKDWGASMQALETLLSEDPDYKDAASLLRTAGKEKRIAELYSQARQLAQAQQWEAVSRIIERINAEDSSYPDPDGLAAKANRELGLASRREKLRLAYARALQELDKGQWQEAHRLLLEVHELDPGYEDTGRLLKRIETKFTAQDEVRRPGFEFSSMIASTKRRLSQFATNIKSRIRF
ncbi:MAG: caspase family protein, partial [Anaerolineales bacterium]